MDADKEYVTQITRRDMREIAAAANMYPGDGIDVTPTDEGLMVSVDRAQLTRWVRAIIAGGSI